MRVNTKIGDIFSVKLDNGKKRFFQLIAFDSTQLNSDVIRVFHDSYPMNENPDFVKIVHSKVDFCVHCVTKLGIKMNLWEKIGNEKNVGSINQILFRDTNDYGSKIDEEPIRISNRWHIWHINDTSFTQVGKLEDKNRQAYIGLVINPLGVIELLNGRKYPINYPDPE